LTNFISKRVVLMLIVLIAVVTTGTLYYRSRSIIEEEMYLTMDFTIDANTDNGAFLRFVTPDGKEKIEVYERRFADGTKIFESRSFKHDLGWWEQSTVGQGEQTLDKVRGVGGNQFYHLLEIMDPAITSLVYEYQVGDKVSLRIVEVNQRRFTAFYRQPWNKEYHQIYGLNENGEALWDIDS